MKKRLKTLYLYDPQPVRAQLQDLQFRKLSQTLDLRDLVRSNIELLQCLAGARIRCFARERRQRLDLIVRQLQASQISKRREIGNRRQLVVVEDDFFDFGGGRQLRDAGGVSEEVLAEGELAEVF